MSVSYGTRFGAAEWMINWQNNFFVIKIRILCNDYTKSYDYKKEYLYVMRPHFKPHNLTEDELMEFLAKCRDFMKQKRQKVDIPENYPLRYKDA